MDDLDEADEQNEEDLMLLGDSFAVTENLQAHILSELKTFYTEGNQGKAYLTYCVNQLHSEDQKLAEKYLEISTNVK